MAIRDRVIQIRVARKERRAWREAAAAARLTVSALVRQAMAARLTQPPGAAEAGESPRAGDRA